MNEDTDLLLSIYNENKALFEITPWYRPVVKSRRKNDLLRSWASVKGTGMIISRPNTNSGLTNWIKYNRENIVLTLGTLMGIGLLIGLFAFIIIHSGGPNPWDKPLPPGIHQRGYGFDIDKGVIDKKESGGGDAPFTSYDLCYRLPDSDGYGAKVKSLPNGSIRIDCSVKDE